ncbi:MAG TPA: ATP-binding protein [Atribacteraceae bacterium]|nr:ATP-binding protein [Atribacteraceae bacterium]
MSPPLLVERLHTAYRNGSFQEKMRFYQGVDLLLIDELGYLPLDGEGAKFFFELVNRRYERKSIVITSNTGFLDWGRIFSNEVIATALLDRLLHHCHILNIKGRSYRLRERQESGLMRREVTQEGGV